MDGTAQNLGRTASNCKLHVAATDLESRRQPGANPCGLRPTRKRRDSGGPASDLDHARGSDTIRCSAVSSKNGNKSVPHLVQLQMAWVEGLEVFEGANGMVPYGPYLGMADNQ